MSDAPVCVDDERPFLLGALLVGVGEVELCGGSAVAQVANPDHLLDQVLGLLEGQVLGAALGLDLIVDDGRSKLGADAGGDEVALPGGADGVDAAEERLSVLMAGKKQQFKKY